MDLTKVENFRGGTRSFDREFGTCNNFIASSLRIPLSSVLTNLK